MLVHGRVVEPATVVGDADDDAVEIALKHNRHLVRLSCAIRYTASSVSASSLGSEGSN